MVMEQDESCKHCGKLYSAHYCIDCCDEKIKEERQLIRKKLEEWKSWKWKKRDYNDHFAEWLEEKR